MQRLTLHSCRLRGLLATSLALSSLLSTPALCQGRIIGWGDDSQGGVSGIPAGTDFVQVSSGFDHQMALRSDGSLASWGSDTAGVVSNTPAGVGFTAITTGHDTSAAVRADGSMVIWGTDTYGIIGGAPAGTSFVQVSLSRQSGLALRANGSVVAWGNDAFGQVSNAPTGNGFTQISQGDFHAMALRSNGAVVSWGMNSYQEVTDSPPGTGFTKISAGSSWSMVLRADGSVYGWGIDGPDVNVHSGAPNDAGYVGLSTGGYQGMVSRPDGSVEAFGFDWGGAVSETPPGGGLGPISAGWRTFLAVTTNTSGNSDCSIGSGLNCPCPGGQTGEGCPSSSFQNEGARMFGGGNASFQDDSFALRVSGLPPSKVGLCIKGSVQLGGGAGVQVGDGALCTSPQRRSQTITSDGLGEVYVGDWRGQPFGSFPGVANVGSPTYYQWWYRDPQNNCSGLGFNFSNSWAVTWTP